MNRVERQSGVLAATLVAGAMLCISPAIAQDVAPKVGFGTPTIDGVAGGSEWDNALRFNMFDGTPREGSSIYVLNDETNIYFLVEIVDSTLTSGDEVAIRFDNANNELLDVNDDVIGAGSGLTTGFGDGYFNGTSYTWDLNSHGQAAETGNGIMNSFEMSHPLNSGDPQDISVIAGDEIGICVYPLIDGVGSQIYTFPNSCIYEIHQQSLYQDIAIAARWIDIDLDINPGSTVNPINLGSKGAIPVAVLTTETFDATQVDPSTVAFGPSGATESHGCGHVEDSDDDGDMDMVLHFITGDTGIACEDTEAILTGEMFSGESLIGSDLITTKNCQYRQSKTLK